LITTRYVICSIRAIRDAVDDRISTIDIFEDITAEGFPVFIPRISFVWNLAREQNDPPQIAGQITVSLDNEQLAQLPLTINFQQALNNRQVVVLGGLVIQHPGTVRAVFHAENVADAVYTFFVRAAPQAAAPQAVPPVQ